MNKTPFEIRLELLKMAKEMLEQDYYARREQITNDWNAQVNVCMSNNVSPPSHPEFESYPSELDIIAKATILNSFISKQYI